jgi:transposase InsO family protein
MPLASATAPQLDLFVSSSAAYEAALARYEALRPVLTGERSLRQQSQHTGVNYWRLWRDLRRFQREGLLGLLDQRTLPHPRGRAPIEALLPTHIQQQIIRLAIAHPFTLRELAQIVRDCYHVPVDYRGIDRVLAYHHLSHEGLQLHYQSAQHAAPPSWPPASQMHLPREPTTYAQRLEQALGPEHLLLRFRTYHEYPTEEQARWRIIELWEVGFRPRRIAKLLAIDPHVVYYWWQRFQTFGLLGLTTHMREATPITTRVSIQVMMEVFQLLDNNPLLGHYRVKMALDAMGYRYGHTTVWQMVALYKHAHPAAPRERHLRNPAERPKQATAPHQVWFIDIRYLVQIEGQWLYSILIFDGYSRAIVGAGCSDRQNLSRVVQVFHGALLQWGAPEEVVSDHAQVFVALSPCLDQLDIRWSPIERGHPWQNLAEGGFAVQRRMLDAYVVGCTEREHVYRQHAQFVQDYQFWGHWAHKRTDAQGRIYYVSPEVSLGQTSGRAVDAVRLRRVFRLRQLTRQVRQYGQIRLHNFGLYVDRALWAQTVEILLYDDALRVEQAEHLIVLYPCLYDPTQRCIMTVDAQGRQQYRHFPVLQLALFTLELLRVVWKMPPYRRLPSSQRLLQAQQGSLFERFAR